LFHVKQRAPASELVSRETHVQRRPEINLFHVKQGPTVLFHAKQRVRHSTAMVFADPGCGGLFDGAGPIHYIRRVLENCG
jgi:hypothetical protein